MSKTTLQNFSIRKARIVSTNDIYSPSFTAAINGEIREFHSKDNFKSYIAKEIESWRWLLEAALPPGVGQELYQNFCLKYLEAPKLALENESDHDYYYNIGKPDLEQSYIENSSIEKNITTNTLKEFGAITAAYTLVYLTNQKRLIAAIGVLEEFVGSPIYSYERATAIQITFNKNDLQRRITKVDEETSSSMLQQFATELLERNSVLDERKAEFMAMTSQIEDEGNKANTFRATAFKRRIVRYRTIARKIYIDAKENLDNAQKDLITSHDYYHNQIQLKASVTYWKNRKDEHTWLKRWWLLFTFIAMAITFGSVSGYYAYGGLSRLANHTYDLQSVGTSASEKTEKSATSDASIAKSTTTNVTITNTDKPVSNQNLLPNIIADLAGALLLISLLTVFIRITLRQYNTHSFLENEAAERVTLTETYLALLHDGNLEAKEDRRLILECLFRPSQVGGLSEIQVATPVELILKNIPKKE